MNAKKHFTFSGVNAPLPIRWANGLARIAKPASDRLVSSNKENLLEAAARQTGLQDWGDHRFKDALGAALESLNQEGKLTFFGRFVLRQFLIENLATRLRLIEVLKRFPEIQQQKIQKPIFITGWYRSGTTHLHNLLAVHPDLRAPLFWELRHPCPTLNPRTAKPDGLIRKVKRDGKLHGYLAPGFSTVHPLEAEKPEECLHLFDKGCAGTTPFFISEAKSFAWWLLSQDFQQAYDFYKFQLQLLNWLRPGRQWVLKWPYHLWHLETLINTFPDATLIQLHRDPREAVPSVCSLAGLARSSFCKSINNAALGKFWLDYYEAGLTRGFKAREKINSKQIIDICYSDLKRNPRAVIKQIQDTIKIGGFKSRTESLQRCSNAAQRKVPERHRYAPSQFGLTADQIRERFSKYIEDYDLHHA